MLVAEVAVGTRLGKYRVTGRLGKGGMAVVYAGEDTDLRRPIAIKVLADSVAREAEVLKRFLLEARAAASLNHPNVVTVHDVGQCGSVYYIVMELVSGGSVQARLKAQGALPWREATRIVADVCRGLAAAHAAGFIHRDVKPANILLAADGSAKLADFGLTKAPTLAPDGLTQPGAMIGTPQYMSPEHCAGEQLDERADLYSLGAAYYSLLVGHPPFDGPDPALILFSHCSAPVPDPRKAVPSVPAECARIIARAMAKPRADRFRNAAEMLRTMLDLLGQSTAIASKPHGEKEKGRTGALPSVSVQQSPVPASGRLSSWRRRPIAFAVGGLVVLFAIIWLFLGSGLFSSAPPSVPDSTASSPPPQPKDKEVAPKKDYRIELRPRARNSPLHKGEVRAVSVGAERLVSVGADGTVRVAKLDSSGRQDAMNPPMTTPDELNAVALSPDGKLVVAGGRNKTMLLGDAVAGKEMPGTLPFISREKPDIWALAFSPSGDRLAVATADDLLLWDFEPPAKFSQTRQGLLLKQRYMVSSVAFSRDGKWLAACTYHNLHLWELPSLKPRRASGSYLSDELRAVAMSDDGRIVAFGSYQGALRIWEPDGGLPPTLLNATLLNDKIERISALAFAPGSATLVIAGEWGGPLRLYDLVAKTMTLIPIGGIAGSVSGLSFSPDGRILAAACPDGRVRLWDVVLIERSK